jgi:hypothetical protein
MIMLGLLVDESSDARPETDPEAAAPLSLVDISIFSKDLFAECKTHADFYKCTIFNSACLPFPSLE